MKAAIYSFLMVILFIGLVWLVGCEKEKPELETKPVSQQIKSDPLSIPGHAWSSFPATNIPKGGAYIAGDEASVAKKWIGGFVRANSFGRIGPDATKSILKVPAINVAPNQAGTLSNTLHNPIRIYPPQGIDSIPMSSFSCVIVPDSTLHPVAVYFDIYTYPQLMQGYYYCTINSGKIYLTWFSLTPFWIKSNPMPLVWVIYNITGSGWISFDVDECLISADGVNNYNVSWKPQYINKH